MSGRIILTILEGAGISRSWATTHLLTFYRIVMAFVGCRLADVLQWAYNEAQGPLEIESSAILDIISSDQFLS